MRDGTASQWTPFAFVQPPALDPEPDGRDFVTARDYVTGEIELADPAGNQSVSAP